MIKSFRDSTTRELFATGEARGVPPDVLRRAFRKLARIDVAQSLRDLNCPAGNHLHSLSGDRAGEYSIRVNRQWRICFRFEDGHAFDVEFCDYH